MLCEFLGRCCVRIVKLIDTSVNSGGIVILRGLRQGLNHFICEHLGVLTVDVPLCCFFVPRDEHPFAVIASARITQRDAILTAVQSDPINGCVRYETAIIVLAGFKLQYRILRAR